MFHIRRVLTRLAAVACALTGASVAQGQRPPTCSAVLTAGAPTPWCAVEEPPRPLETSLQEHPARYPHLMRAAYVGGQVAVEATITDTGVVDLRSVRVLHPTHDLFLMSVKQALGRWRFMAGRLAGRPVDVRAVFRVEFRIPRDTLPVVEIVERPRSDSSGLTFVLGWRVPPVDPSAVIDSARFPLLIERLARSYSEAPARRGHCIEVEIAGPAEAGVGLTDALFAHLASRGLSRFPRSRCPPTYASMIYSPNQPSRPPGALDPHMLRISGLRAWTRDIYILQISSSVGTGGTVESCQANFDAERRSWELFCTGLRRWVS